MAMQYDRPNQYCRLWHAVLQCAVLMAFAVTQLTAAVTVPAKTACMCHSIYMNANQQAVVEGSPGSRSCRQDHGNAEHTGQELSADTCPDQSLLVHVPDQGKQHQP